MSATRTLDHPLASLPRPRTALLGRDREVGEICELVTDPDVRLVTLMGPGGVGKTRLATHVATAAIDAFDGSVAFVPLAAIRDPRLVFIALGQAFGFAGEPDDDYEASLTAMLRDRRALVVLDNLEQVLQAAPAIQRLLDNAPGLVILATSQVALGVPDEHLYLLDPLLTLDPEIAPVASLQRLDAVDLFIERARAVDPSFTTDDSDVVVAIAKICRRLDGLPLAIELAAARANVLSPHTLLERLEKRLAALGESRGDVPDRLRTMQAAIGWSYDLLQPQEQALFRRLSVFKGTWTADAIDPGPADGTDARRTLATLVRRSLVRRAGLVAGEPRYAMLQTLMDYGVQQLARLGEEQDARLAHALSMTRVAEAAEPYLTGRQQQEVYERLDADLAGLRAAVEWALGHGREDLVLRIGGALWRYFSIRALVTESRGWLDRALIARHPGSMPYRVKALIGAGFLAEDRRDLDVARDYLEQALHLAEALGDKAAEGQASIGLGTVAHDQGDYETATIYHERSVALARETGNGRALAVGYANLGAVAYFQGRLDESLRHFTAGTDILLDLGDLHSASVGLSNMAAIANESGDFQQAVQHLRRSLETLRQIGSRRDLPSTLVNLGEAYRELGDHDQARLQFAEAVRLARENEDIAMYAHGLHGMAVLEYVEKAYRRSAELVLESIEILTLRNDPHSLVENGHLVALLCLATGHHAEVARILAANERICGELGIGVLEPRRLKVEDMAATAREALGDEGFAEASAAGRDLDVEALAHCLIRVARGIVGPRHAALEPEPEVPSASENAHNLTAREMDVLRLLAAGKSTSGIAEELFVSARTVTTHVTHILEKLDAPNRTAAVAYALREGLVPEARA